MLIINEGAYHKTKDEHFGFFPIIQVHTNDTVRIQNGCMTEQINIGRLTPYFEQKGQHPPLDVWSPYMDGSE